MPQPTILISTNSSWNIINFRSGLISRFQAAGYRVLALAPPDRFSDRFGQLGVEFHPIEIDQKGMSPRRDLKLLRDYRRALKALRPDIFLGYTAKPNVYGSLAAHGLGIPVINNVSGLGTAFIRENWLTRVVSCLYRTAFRRSHTIFFQNRDDLGLFVDRRLVSAARARLLPGSGIDLDRYRPAPLPGGERTAFLLVARLLRDKGVGEYVEAARRLRLEIPQAEFRLLGPADAANPTAFSAAEVNAWQKEGLVTYLGAADDVRPHIEAVDCVVLPSYREGLPRTLLEGAAMARPLVATDVPGCRDIVEDGISGYLCASHDAASLAAAMGNVAALSVDARRTMGLAGRALVERRFDERIVHQFYLEAISDALGLERQAER